MDQKRAEIHRETPYGLLAALPKFHLDLEATIEAKFS